MDLALTDRVVLVTGGSSGVGLATVKALRAEGSSVATCARDAARLRAALEDAGLVNDEVLAVEADVLDRAAIGRLLDDIVERYGRLDGLVNNAGRSRFGRLADVCEQDWRSELDLKFGSLLNPTMAALPLLRRSEGASIVNINAVLAVQPDVRLITTSAARAGVLNLSKSLAEELAPDGIRVNSVCLGLIDTGQWSRRYAAASTDRSYPEWMYDLACDRGVLLGRLGEADEVAAVVVFLLSKKASYVTGSAIDIAGGSNRSTH